MLYLIEDFISKEEEALLIKEIDAREWDNTLSRRVQHYGWRYDYTKRAISEDDFLGEIPAFLQNTRDEVLGKEIDKGKVQVIINEYQPGQGISAHVDQPRIFGGEIHALSRFSVYHGVSER